MNRKYFLDPFWTKNQVAGYEDDPFNPIYSLIPSNCKNIFELFSGSLVFTLNIPKHTYNQEDDVPKIYTNDILPLIGIVIDFIRKDPELFTQVINNFIYSESLFNYFSIKEGYSVIDAFILESCKNALPILWENKLNSRRIWMDFLPEPIKDKKYVLELSRRLGFIEHYIMDWLDFYHNIVKEPKNSILIADPFFSYSGKKVYGLDPIDFKKLSLTLLDFEKRGGKFIFFVYSKEIKNKYFPNHNTMKNDLSGYEYSAVVYNW